MSSSIQCDFSSAFTEKTPRIIAAAKLLKASGRKKYSGFLVEGLNCVDAAVATGAARDIFITQSAFERYQDVLIAAKNMGVYIHPITDKAASVLGSTVTTPGIFALCADILWSPKDVLGRSPQLVSVPVDTNDPGNAGTLIRLSDAMGADAVLFAGLCTDPQGPKTVRSSAGSLFHIPVAKDPNKEAVIERLRSKGLCILATSSYGDTSLDDAEEILAKPSAWLFGNEAHGLDQSLIEQADYRISIPIRGRAESLNLATAASICLYASAKAQAQNNK